MRVAQLSLENLLHSINILNAIKMNHLWLITVCYDCVEPTLHPKYFLAYQTAVYTCDWNLLQTRQP